MAIRVNTGFEVNTQLPIDLRTIANTTADRNAISASWRFEGLSVYVLDIEKEYRLIGGTTNSNWTEWPISSSYALSASWAPTSSFGLETGSTYPFTSSWAVSASWAPTGSRFGLETGSTYPITASWAISSSRAISASIADTASYGLTAFTALSSSYADRARCSDNVYILTASNNVTYSLTFASGPMGCQPLFIDSQSDLTYNPSTNTLYVTGPVTSSWFYGTSSQAVTASNLTCDLPSQKFVNTPNYVMGTKIINLDGTFRDTFSVAFNVSQSCYLTLTLHNYSKLSGSVNFYGEYQLVKDGSTIFTQPGMILQQSNMGGTLITSQINDDALVPTNASSSVTVQLKTPGDVISQSVLTYELRGNWIDVDRNIPASPNTFGDDFESYPVGPITNLNFPSLVFGTNRPVFPGPYGIWNEETVDDYTPGSTIPNFASGSGWIGPGVVF